MSPLRRQATAPIAGSSLSLGAILGIAIGGSALLLIICVSFVVSRLRRKDQLERARIEALEAPSPERIQLATALRNIYPPETCRLQTSTIRLFPNDDDAIRWVGEDITIDEPLAKANKEIFVRERVFPVIHRLQRLLAVGLLYSNTKRFVATHKASIQFNRHSEPSRSARLSSSFRSQMAQENVFQELEDKGLCLV
jgi:hypothetical protein